jgi:hypothetical protein
MKPLLQNDKTLPNDQRQGLDKNLYKPNAEKRTVESFAGESLYVQHHFRIACDPPDKALKTPARTRGRV